MPTHLILFGKQFIGPCKLYIYEQNEIFAINKTEIKEQSLGDPVNRFKLCIFAISILNGMSSDHDFRDTRRQKNFVHLVSLHCVFI